MKVIHAYVKPHKLTPVTMAVHKVDGVTGMSILEARGFGRSLGRSERHRVADGVADYAPCVKIEMFCRDAIAGLVVARIREAAHTGLRGDGKIYILPAEDAVRIETGQCGEEAV